MQSFLRRHEADVKGVLSGFDRLRFRGTIRWLASPAGLGSFLSSTRVLLKDFKAWARGLTDRVVDATEELARATGRPIVYLPSSRESKEGHALALAEADGITEGLIGVLKCVEPCHTFSVRPDRPSKQLELRYQPSKCAHFYFYLRHPQMGLLHLRLQTWLPFTAHVCINGRDWLARQLRQAGIGFERRDNCLVDIADLTAAQQFVTAQLQTDWPALLDGLVRQVHKAHPLVGGERPLDYYWSAEQTEWATDVLFRSPEALARIYPRLTRHALTALQSGAVLHFLGRRPEVWRFHGSDLHTTLRTRPEGTCVKHSCNGNSVKMYDKQQSVLRVETTINNPRDLKAYRPRPGDPEAPKAWLPLRKGVADLHRRAEVSQKANERYLEALAAVDHPETLGETVTPICQPTTWKGRRVRGLQPFRADDHALLAAVLRGEFALNGFRNRDLRPLLFGSHEVSEAERRRQSAKVTRLLRLLRAHGLISKVPSTHRYQLTERGRTTMTALLAAQQASTDHLTKRDP